MSASLAMLLVISSPVDPSVRNQYNADYTSYDNCIVAKIEEAIAAKTPAELFTDSFTKSCLKEEKAYRQSSIALFRQLGKSEEAAATEADHHIAESRQYMIDAQKLFIETGQMPRL